MAGIEKLQPNPNGPLPEPESYERESWGPKPERPGLVAIGTLMEPVPVTGLAANFSPMPRIAPPPLGKEIEGAEKLDCSGGLLFSCRACWVVLSQHLISLFQPCTVSMEQQHAIDFENSFPNHF